jgi:hypothetical protein
MLPVVTPDNGKSPIGILSSFLAGPPFGFGPDDRPFPAVVSFAAVFGVVIKPCLREGRH